MGTGWCSPKLITLKFVSRASDNVTLDIGGVSDGCVTESTIEETWRLSLTKGARHLYFASWGGPIVQNKVRTNKLIVITTMERCLYRYIQSLPCGKVNRGGSWGMLMTILIDVLLNLL